MKRTKTEAVGAPDPNAKDGEGCTPLHLAAEAGDARLVAQFLRRGAKVDVRSNYVSAWTDAYTPLAIAVRKGHGKVARLLAKAGADLNARSESRTTPLLLALTEEKYDLALWLVKAGADVNDVEQGPDNTGWTALHFAALKDRNVSLVKALLARKADPRATDVEGESPLDLAKGARASHVAALLSKAVGASTMRKTRRRSGKPDPALTRELFEAVDSDPRRAPKLIAAGADVTARDTDGSTPLHHVGVGCEFLAKALVEAGADVNAKDSEGYTPLHLVCRLEWGHEVAKVLIRLGAELEARDEIGSTPLHRAAQSCSTYPVEVLLAAGATPDASDTSGQTPLEYCVQNLHLRSDRVFSEGIKVVRLLRLRGADAGPKRSGLKNRSIRGSRRKALLRALATRPARPAVTSDSAPAPSRAARSPRRRARASR